jgi:hypothetical protein
MQRFHGTAARQLVLIDSVQGSGPVRRSLGEGGFKVSPQPRIRLMQKDMYAELTRRRRRAQIAARQWVEGRRGN